ncbi:YceI family protein [Fulvivirgaceae bacterium BMA10]|uniref:YceI family protein n=1 Tax=Splendidivirga corallicola TaxID=3051826 RepID=A0ABT8KNU2_9BACT|nr:YceI family protein [Fulvivirgaceae bacterium BMA10]
MRKYIVLFLSMSLVGLSAQAQVKWMVDPSHSSIRFEVDHLVVSRVSGDFTEFKGSVESMSESDFTDAKIEATIQVSSIDSRNMSRDKHLRQDDFFNVKEYPIMQFRSTSVIKQDENTYTIIGDLTIRDVTKPFEMEARMGGSIVVDGKLRAGITASGSINRFDYHLKWNDTLDSGGLVVGEEVDISLNIQLVKEE